MFDVLFDVQDHQNHPQDHQNHPQDHQNHPSTWVLRRPISDPLTKRTPPHEKVLDSALFREQKNTSFILFRSDHVLKQVSASDMLLTFGRRARLVVLVLKGSRIAKHQEPEVFLRARTFGACGSSVNIWNEYTPKKTVLAVSTLLPKSLMVRGLW